MNFCENCDNKMHPFEESSKLYYKCNDCGNNKEYNEFIVSQTKYMSNNLKKIPNYLKKNFRYDCTLKRSKKHTCKNESCDNSYDGEVIIMCDKDTIENIYICSSCLSEWKYS
tara:strand:- start:4 stop:339 length:336 start_codon:yes stop_codon:yes gene_type:complete